MIEEKDIKRVVETIVKVANPQKVILFGSYASGTPDEDSDLDFLVIITKSLTHKEKIDLWYNIEKGLFGSGVSTDIIIKSRYEIEETKNEKWMISYFALRTGKVVYEAKPLSSMAK
ncbi:nucleotidyltransferase domain-containing protein [candidate division WOR-3 bacterium]|nr:nucleotidyltransferase domain-containing protein [candidate division WOR-3 bacterium]